jgi:hypothetical protein
MDRKDIINLQILLEDLGGANFPQYGSVSPINLPVVGTEGLRDGYVRIPDIHNEIETDKVEKDKDDEDQETETPLERIIDNIKETIRDIEEKRKNRFTLETENFVSGFVSGAMKPGEVVQRVANADLGKAIDELKYNEKPKTPIGYGEGQKKPKVGQNISLSQEPKLTAKIIKVNDSNKTFDIELTNPEYSFYKNGIKDIGIDETKFIKAKKATATLTKIGTVGEGSLFKNYEWIIGTSTTKALEAPDGTRVDKGGVIFIKNPTGATPGLWQRMKADGKTVQSVAAGADIPELEKLAAASKKTP